VPFRFFFFFFFLQNTVYWLHIGKKRNKIERGFKSVFDNLIVLI